MNAIEIILGVSLILNVILIIGARNILLQNEELEDTLLETVMDVQQKVGTAYQTMQDVDIRGSFESDDEVGAVFTELKDIIEKLNETI
jgi:predicted SpoU family rRNA methylase